MEQWRRIASHIAETTHTAFVPIRTRNVAGGCINNAVVLEGEHERYFVKRNRKALQPMFEAESAALDELFASATVRVPRPICHGIDGNSAYLVLEFLPFGHDGANAGARLGQSLAAMHRCTRTHFGWHRDNTIGSTPQPNTPTASWPEFWREYRLGFQLSLAADNGHGGRIQKLGERVMQHLDALFDGHTPSASLLHGDLWSGNYGVLTDGTPCVFDPATYYGDRETDIAMTELFGGFSANFYAAYRDAHPLEAGYAVRKHLYNLYHVLNHLNLFGGGYAHQAERMMEQLLSEVR